VLQKSKVATQQIFRENTKQKTIADSGTLNRVAEVACKFDARGCVPSHLYTKAAPTARRILIIGARGLLQHNRHTSEVANGSTDFLFEA
jgi:hypothetical protein